MSSAALINNVANEVSTNSPTSFIHATIGHKIGSSVLAMDSSVGLGTMADFATQRSAASVLGKSDPPIFESTIPLILLGRDLRPVRGRD
jgi:hypothetical protein